MDRYLLGMPDCGTLHDWLHTLLCKRATSCDYSHISSAFNASVSDAWLLGWAELAFIEWTITLVAGPMYTLSSIHLRVKSLITRSHCRIVKSWIFCASTICWTALNSLCKQSVINYPYLKTDVKKASQQFIDPVLFSIHLDSWLEYLFWIIRWRKKSDIPCTHTKSDIILDGLKAILYMANTNPPCCSDLLHVTFCRKLGIFSRCLYLRRRHQNISNSLLMAQVLVNLQRF